MQLLRRCQSSLGLAGPTCEARAASVRADSCKFIAEAPVLPGMP